MHVGMHRGGVAAAIHRPPQLAEQADEAGRMGLAGGQQLGEGGLPRQQPDRLREHAEDAAHQEGGDGVGCVRALQIAGQAGQQLRDLARHLGPAPRRIERQRLPPDRRQPVARLRPAQVGEIDPEALAVGKLGVVPAGAGKVGIEVEAEPDIAHDQEWRARLLGRQIAHVGLRLPLGAKHLLRPAGGVADRLATLGLRLGLAEKGGLTGGIGTLLGFQDEAAAAIEVDPARGRPLIVVMVDDGSLEPVIPEPAACRRRPVDLQHVAQLVQERDVVGALGLFGAIPARDETVGQDVPGQSVIHGRRVSP